MTTNKNMYAILEYVSERRDYLVQDFKENTGKRVVGVVCEVDTETFDEVFHFITDLHSSLNLGTVVFPMSYKGVIYAENYTFSTLQLKLSVCETQEDINKLLGE